MTDRQAGAGLDQQAGAGLDQRAGAGLDQQADTELEDAARTGRRFVRSLADKDEQALVGLFAERVSFRGLTPGRFWEAQSPEQVVHDVLFQWFEPSDVIESVEQVEPGRVADLYRVDYRLTVRNPGGRYAVEQRAYFDVDEQGRISRMQAICGGFRPLAQP